MKIQDAIDACDILPNDPARAVSAAEFGRMWRRAGLRDVCDRTQKRWLHQLEVLNLVTVTTVQGEHRYHLVRPRHALRCRGCAVVTAAP